MAYPTPHIYYSIGGAQQVYDPYINWLNYVLEQTSVPRTISTLYWALSSAIFNPKVAASFSGGGFSNCFPRPSYRRTQCPPSSRTSATSIWASASSFAAVT